MNASRPGQAPPLPDRPSRPLVVKCSYDGSTRRVAFPSAATCRLESLRSRVEECFSLSASPFHLAYTDDDGEDFSISSEVDLTDAILYFVSGDDDGVASAYSGHSGGHSARQYAFSTQKITLRIDVIVEYDGPSLSDTSSLSSFQSGLDDAQSQSGSSGWRSSGYSSSYTRYAASSLEHQVIDEQDEDEDGASTEYQASVDGSVKAASRSNHVESQGQDLASSPKSDGSASPPEDNTLSAPRRRSQRMRAASQYSSSKFAQSQSQSRPSSASSLTALATGPALTGPESNPAPSLLTHSELGTRWLREQSKLAKSRRLGHGGAGANRRYDSDNESLDSDDESLGDLELVQDARGKYYYSYQATEDSFSDSEVDFDNGSGPSSRASTSTSDSSPPSTPRHKSFPLTSNGPIEPTGPPILAPDCSACGVRLDYIRYVCQTCGEGDMWKENAPGKAAFVPPAMPSGSSTSDSDSTESAARTLVGSHTLNGAERPRSRSNSISTHASRGSGSKSSGGHSPRPITDLDLQHEGHSPRNQAEPLSRGYELCVTCIEVHGISHAKAAAKQAKANLSSSELRRRRRAGEVRHTFRERIWSSEGWVDVEYSENVNCTICQSSVQLDRFRCVSCPKFDMCRSCYRKVEDIHPAHAFLSLPDAVKPDTAVAGPSNGPGRDGSSVKRPMRHPGAFCHNCLQDIVGPRFHCAVCPSWDLCIQCEGVEGVGHESGHASDHIMMKIPVPLETNEVEAVSRLARDRWFQQDATRLAAATGSSSSRSSSPTNETVYGGGSQRTANETSTGPPSQVVAIIQRDALDHGLRCNSCNEWIMGRRYQCANCPSDPVAYNLCSICELRSYRIHDSRHVFFKFDRPVHITLSSPGPLLPLLYRSRAGEVPAGTVINVRDPTAYLKHVLHRETLCDIHGDQIRGIWLRCAHCPGGFDICQEAERIADHDATHVFVVFKARVDMSRFRQIADLAGTHSRPLLTKQTYLS